ncbi:MAG: hypothetical protein QM727_11755 [Niabella sp.]
MYIVGNGKRHPTVIPGVTQWSRRMCSIVAGDSAAYYKDISKDILDFVTARLGEKIRRFGEFF